MVTRLKKPMRRVVRTRSGGELVVELTDDGVTLRGKGRRRRRCYTWEQLFSLAVQTEEILRAAEDNGGRRVMDSMGILKGGSP